LPDLASHKSSADHDGRYFTKGRGTATDVNCSGCVGAGDLADNAVTSAKLQDLAVTLAKLGFDPATQSELDSHKSELQSAGTLNPAGNPVDWTKLKGVPAGSPTAPTTPARVAGR
jgi:hypothetical protein